MWVIILFIHHFSKKLWKKYTLNLFFIDNEKGIAHFKLASLDNGYSGVYLQKCKVTGNPTLLVVLYNMYKPSINKVYLVYLFIFIVLFASKLVCQKWLKLSLTFDLCELYSEFYHKIEFYNDTCT